MRKLFILGVAFIVSVAMLLTACKKDESNNNSNNNTENPGGGNQEDPPTTGVIPNAVSDIDGNSYDAQVWMAENLRTTKYADGTIIPLGTTLDIPELSYTEPYRYTPGYNQSNEENMTNVAYYGYLYNWPAVIHEASSSESNPSHVQGICPTGWHVPSDVEWTQLTDYVSSHSQYVCGDNNNSIAKALASTTGWYSSTETCVVGNAPHSNNATGFSAFPAGYYNYFYGYNDGFGSGAYFWSATDDNGINAYGRCLLYDYAFVLRSDGDKCLGLSVRCVRD